MKFYINDNGSYQVVISERNAKALLSKLNMPGSHRSILCGDAYINGEPVSAHLAPIIISIEDDATHYADREAGRMHSDTEKDIKSWDVT